MATYYLKGQGVQHPYDAPGFAGLRQRVDVPKFALGEFLEDSVGAPVILSSGFTTSDKLVIMKIEADTLVRTAGIKLITPEGAVASVAGGDDSSSDGWFGGFDLNGSAGSVGLTIVGGVYGADNVMGKLYTADDNLLLEFSGNCAAAVFDVFLETLKVF